MKVLITRSRATDPSVEKISYALAKNGFDVHLLIWDRSGKLLDKPKNNYFIHYFRLCAPTDSVFVFFYLPIWWVFEFFFLIKNSDSATIIHACDLDTLYPAIIVKSIKNIKLNYTIFDFYADNFPKNTPYFIRQVIGIIEKLGLQYAHTVFLVDETRINQIKGVKSKNVVYIYNTPEERFLIQSEQITRDQNTLILFYAGVLHNSRGLSSIIQAVKKINNIKFIVAGTGPEQRLFSNFDNITNNKIVYLGWISYENVIKQTIDSDCLIALYDLNIPNNKYASPNKLFEAMMCSKPIIVNEGTSMAKIVKNEECGLIVPYTDINAIQNAIETLKNDPKLRFYLGNNGRDAYDKKYNWNIMKKRLIDVYAKDRLDYSLGVR